MQNFLDVSQKPDLADVLFPVLSADVVVSHLELGGTIQTTHKAIVDQERRRVLAVVTQGYRLITNSEAIERGKTVFGQVFSEETSDAMELFNIVQPQSRSFCLVDFTHKGHSFEVAKGDAWLPFLRVTNSYNKTKPLRFDFGFCRAICKNGVIFDPRKATVSRYHTQAGKNTSDLAGIDVTEVEKMQAQFIEKTHNLKRFAVPPKGMLPLTCKVLDIKVTKEQVGTPKGRERIVEIGQKVQRLTSTYFEELGHNGYAALNVLTDFASRPEGIGLSPAAQVHPLQARAGLWIDDFIAEIKSDQFDFDRYVQPYQESANLISQTL